MNKKAFDIAKLENGDTNKDIAEYLNISEQSVSNKINENETEFKQGEIAKLIKRWKLSDERVVEIFFSELVSKLDTEGSVNGREANRREDTIAANWVISGSAQSKS